MLFQFASSQKKIYFTFYKRAGGFLVQKESDEWIREHGTIDTGDVAVTSGGNLRCKYIIHAVGPIW